eukprot:Clim_evm4s43 gene=Clim_evmTU4s43
MRNRTSVKEWDFRKPQKESATIVDQIAKIERRTFPKHESMADDFTGSAKQLKGRNRTVFVATDSATEELTVLGYLIIEIAYPTAQIHKVAVESSVRGKGIGTQLLTASIDKARASPCAIERVRLQVDPKRAAAVRLYSAAGFEPAGILKDYYIEGRDAHLYELTL